jgi:tetratricopeptide (TPR) repeat protein
VWRPENCTSGHRRADEILVKKLTRGFPPPTAARIVSERGWQKMRQRKFEEALRRFHQSLLISQETVDAWRGAGTALSELGLLEEAVKVLERGKIVGPKDVPILFQLSRTYFEMKAFAKSEALAKEITMINDRFSDAYKMLALTALERGDKEQSKKMYQKAIELQGSRDLGFEKKINRGGQ